MLRTNDTHPKKNKQKKNETTSRHTEASWYIVHRIVPSAVNMIHQKQSGQRDRTRIPD